MKCTKKDAGENKEITKEKRVKLESPKLMQKLNQRFKIKFGRLAKKESSLLSVDDKKELDGDEWLPDQHINALNKLLLKQIATHPKMDLRALSYLMNTRNARQALKILFKL